MASTKKPKVAVSQSAKDLVTRQIQQLIEQLKQKLAQYERQIGEPYPIQLVDTTKQTKVDEAKVIEKKPITIQENKSEEDKSEEPKQEESTKRNWFWNK